MANTFKVKKILGASGIFSSSVEAPNLVYNTGNQTISGVKTFTTRPTVNGANVLLSGEIITSGDLTGYLPYPTIDKLQGYKLDLNAGPADRQVLQWDAGSSSWRAGAIPAGGNGGGGVFYFFNFANTSGIAPTGGLPTTGNFPLALLGRNYDIGSGQAISADLDPRETDVLITSFVTASGDPRVTNIPAGLWDFNIWASVNSTSAKESSILAKVHIYNQNNSTYRLVSQSDKVYLYDKDIVAQYILNVTMPQTGILATERIYVEIYGSKYTPLNRRITLYFDSYRPSHVHTTIPSVAGDGVVKVVNGVFQTPATGIFNADVDNNANIAQSKIANLSSDLTTIRNTGTFLDGKINSLSGYSNSTFATIANLALTGSNLQTQINNLDLTYATDASVSGVATNLATTGSTLNTKIDNLSGYSNNTFATIANLAATGSANFGRINSLSGISLLKDRNQTHSGDLNVTGHFSAASKSFLIQHPVDLSKKLQYGSLESPYHGVRLTDKNKIVFDFVRIDLPNYISSLVHEKGVNVQLTNINHSKVLFVKEVNVSKNYFEVGLKRSKNDKNEYEFYWSFTAERKDIPKLTVEF